MKNKIAIKHFNEENKKTPESQKLWENLQEIAGDVDVQELAAVRKQIIVLQSIEYMAHSKLILTAVDAEQQFDDVFPRVSRRVDELLQKALQ